MNATPAAATAASAPTIAPKTVLDIVKANNSAHWPVLMQLLDANQPIAPEVLAEVKAETTKEIKAILLFHAARRGQLEACQTLKTNGADINCALPVMVSQGGIQRQAQISVLHIALMQKHSHVVNWLRNEDVLMAPEMAEQVAAFLKKSDDLVHAIQTKDTALLLSCLPQADLAPAMLHCKTKPADATFFIQCLVVQNSNETNVLLLNLLNINAAITTDLLASVRAETQLAIKTILLFYAAMHGQLAACKELIAKGADFMGAINGHSIIKVALMNSRYELLAWLCTDDRPAAKAALFNLREFQISLLTAIANKNREAVLKLLTLASNDSVLTSLKANLAQIDNLIALYHAETDETAQATLFALIDKLQEWATAEGKTDLAAKLMVAPPLEADEATEPATTSPVASAHAAEAEVTAPVSAGEPAAPIEGQVTKAAANSKEPHDENTVQAPIVRRRKPAEPAAMAQVFSPQAAHRAGPSCESATVVVASVFCVTMAILSKLWTSYMANKEAGPDFGPN